MKKLSKLVLNKANIDQMDILKKKQMRNLWGGKFCCSWYCTIDSSGSPGHDVGSGNSYNECWNAAEVACPYPGYGFRIEGSC